MRRAAPRGQVLVIFAVLLVVLLGFAGVAIDVGRVTAERRHAQAAADAGALAACRALIAGETDTAAATAAQQVTLANLQNSPAGASAVIASPPSYEDLDGSGAVDADELVSGIVVAGTTVRVAVDSTVDTMLAQVVGFHDARHRRPGPLRPPGRSGRPDRRASLREPAGPGERLRRPPRDGRDRAGRAWSTRSNPRGYDVRTPASEGAPGPQFTIYGPNSKAHNDSSFRGFVGLDVRNFEGTDTRVYYNGVTAGMNPNTLKDKEGAYLVTGYPGPQFPPVATPPTGATQVAVLSGNSTSFVVQQFDDTFRVGDRRDARRLRRHGHGDPGLHDQPAGRDRHSRPRP